MFIFPGRSAVQGSSKHRPSGNIVKRLALVSVVHDAALTKFLDNRALSALDHLMMATTDSILKVHRVLSLDTSL